LKGSATDRKIRIILLKTAFYYIIQAGLELSIFLPPISKFQDYRCAPPYLTGSSTIEKTKLWLSASFPFQLMSQIGQKFYFIVSFLAKN
jgi:hypothetical protein